MSFANFRWCFGGGGLSRTESARLVTKTLVDTRAPDHMFTIGNSLLRGDFLKEHASSKKNVAPKGPAMK